jgi:hypothetical protein
MAKEKRGEALEVETKGETYVKRCHFRVAPAVSGLSACGGSRGEVVIAGIDVATKSNMLLRHGEVRQNLHLIRYRGEGDDRNKIR